MNKLTDVFIRPLKNFKYLKPLNIEYILNGKKKTCSTLAVHKGVIVLLFNTTRQVFLFVKQFRPVIYINSIPEKDRIGKIDTVKYPIELGITIELCSGIVDKDKSLEQIAAEEIDEECGYVVTSDRLKKITSYRSEVSRQGSIQTLFYCEVTDGMKRNSGNKEEGIDIVEMTVPEVGKFISQRDCRTTAILLYGVHWFLNNKLKVSSMTSKGNIVD